MGVWLDHHQLDPAGVCGWTVGTRTADVAQIVGTTSSKPGAVYAVSRVDRVHGVDFAVQVPSRVQGVPATSRHVYSHLHSDEGCNAERTGKEAGDRRNCVWSGSEKG